MADIFRDFVYTRNTVAVTDLDTSVQVEDVSLFPSNTMLAKGEFFIAFDSTLSYPGTFEICRVTSINVATKTLSVLRAQAGTPALPHSIVTYIKGTLSSDQARRLRAGFSGTVAPAPDLDMLSVGDQFLHTTEQRLYVYTGQAAYLRDSFNRAANTLTMGTTEVQTVVGEINSVQPPLASQVVPYVGTWEARGTTTSVFGIKAPGQAYLVSGSAGAASVVNVASVNFDFSFDAWMSTTAGSDYGLFFRVNTANTHGYYLQFLGTTATLFRVVGGVFANVTSASYVTGALRTWRVTCSGNAISVFRDGTLAIAYTETIASFLATAAVPVVGGYVGFRYGNAAAISDTSLYFCNYTSTVVGNVGLNNPTAQGWAPVAPSPGTASYLFTQMTSTQNALTKTVALVDEMVQALVGIEATQAIDGLGLAVTVTNYDDLLDAFKALPVTDGLGKTLAVVSATVDDVIDILSTLVQSGSGNPSGTPRDGEVYVDRVGKSVFSGFNGSWSRISYSGPGAISAPVTFIESSTTANNVGSFPVGTLAGDLVIAQFNTAQISSVPTPPVGWTQIASGVPVSQYYNSFCIAYRMATATDLSAGFSFGPSTTGQTTARTYRNAAFGTSTFVQGAASNNTIITGPTLSNVSSRTVVNWFSSANNLHNPEFLAPLQSNVRRAVAIAGLSAQTSQDEIAVGAGATTARQVRWTTGDNASAYAFTVFSLNAASEVVLTPGFRLAAGIPTDAAITGTVHLDTASNAVYAYSGTEWLGVNRRVVSMAADYIARGGDHILATTGSSGRGTGTVDFDTSTFNHSASDPTAVAVTTTKSNVLIVGLRATWQGTGFTATLNGAAMTLRRRQYSGSQGPDSSLFTANALVPPGAQTVSFTGPIAFGISWASVLAFSGVTTVGATYTGAHNGAGSTGNIAGTLSITLPAGIGGMVYLYNQVNGGTPPSMSDGGGLTWTSRGSAPHGSQNASSQWTAPYSPAQAGQVITVVTTTDTSWQSTQAAAFPSAGDPAAYDPGNFSVITLPGGARGASVTVQSNDLANNEIRIVPASGTINGNPQENLFQRFQAMSFVSDGANWFSSDPVVPVVLSVTKSYVAHNAEVVLVTASTANLTVTLPPARRDRTVTVKKMDATTFTVNVVGSGTTPQQIEGAGSVTLVTQYETQTYVSDGVAWWRT